MAYDVKVLADSVSELGHRLTTFEVTFWRAVLAEFNTHRTLSRNSASSRAIPAVKQIRRVLDDPFMPDKFGINEPGMQSMSFHDGMNYDECLDIWLMGRLRAITTTLELLLGTRVASRLLEYDPVREIPHEDTLRRMWPVIEQQLGPKYRRENPGDVDDILNVHKQLSNRPLEPYMWHTVIVTATEWDNFFALRIDGAAQREIQVPVSQMRQAMAASTPRPLRDGEWHLPLVFNSADPVGVDFEDWHRNPDPLFWAQISAARCARVSYLTHDSDGSGGRRDLKADLALCQNLVRSGHMSPLEHAARPMTLAEFKANSWSGNFRGWHQLRKDIAHEDNFSEVLARP